MICICCYAKRRGRHEVLREASRTARSATRTVQNRTKCRREQHEVLLRIPADRHNKVPCRRRARIAHRVSRPKRDVQHPARPNRLRYHLSIHLVIKPERPLSHQDHLRMLDDVQRRRRRPRRLHRLVQLHHLAGLQPSMQHHATIAAVRRRRCRNLVKLDRPRRPQRPATSRWGHRLGCSSRRRRRLRSRKLRSMRLRFKSISHARSRYRKRRQSNTNITTAHVFHSAMLNQSAHGLLFPNPRT